MPEEAIREAAATSELPRGLASPEFFFLLQRIDRLVAPGHGAGRGLKQVLGHRHGGRRSRRVCGNDYHVVGEISFRARLPAQAGCRVRYAARDASGEHGKALGHDAALPGAPWPENLKQSRVRTYPGLHQGVKHVKATRKALVIVRWVNTYVLIFALLIVIQKYTLGLIPQLRNLVLFNKIYFYEVLFTVNAILIILLFIRVSFKSYDS